MKLNDYCEFPERLDVEPYTKEGLLRRELVKKGPCLRRPAPPSPLGVYCATSLRLLVYFRLAPSGVQLDPEKPTELHRPRQYYEYELTGILVHRGIADSGHYYSFIKVGLDFFFPTWLLSMWSLFRRRRRKS